MNGTLRDILLIARFELLRAARTRRALAFTVLYLVATCGAAYLFIQIVGELENSVARELGVSTTRIPGSLTHELVKKQSFQDGMARLTGFGAIGDLVQRVPLLAIFHLWFGFFALPFFAASTSAESISLDAASRALRFELLRTGRLELVLGRFVGQLALTALACLCAAVGVQVVGMLWMRGFSPPALAFWLGWFSLRGWVFGIPFVGIGVAASQLTDSTGWARTAAGLLTVSTWILSVLLVSLRDTRWGLVSDIGLQLLPQSWMLQLWEPLWPLAALVCAAMGLCATLLGTVRFLRRDL